MNHWGFYLPLGAFLIHQILQYVLRVEIPFLDAYLDPFCAGALACYVVEDSQWRYSSVRKLSTLDSLLVALAIAMISEGLFPLLSADFTQDYIDILSVFLGSGWYLLFRDGTNVDHHEPLD